MKPLLSKQSTSLTSFNIFCDHPSFLVVTAGEDIGDSSVSISSMILKLSVDLWF